MGFPTGGTGTSAPLPTGAATAARQDTPSAVTMSGGRTVAAFPVSQQSSDPLYLKNIRLEPGDVLAVGLRTASSTATAELGIDWDED